MKMERLNVHTIIFDFGGPIRDSRVALNEAYNNAVERLIGRKLEPRERFDAEDTWKMMGLPGLTKEDTMVEALWTLKIKEIKEGGLEIDPAQPGRRVPLDLKKILERENPLEVINKALKRYRIPKNRLEKHLNKWRAVFRAAFEDKETEKARWLKELARR